MRKIIIGLSGKKQSGKNTVCSFIQDELAKDKSIKIYSFADPLKNFCIDVLGLNYNQCYGTDDEKNTFTDYKWERIPDEIKCKYLKNSPKNEFITSREMMQMFGTDIIRNFFDENIWSKATIRLIKKEGYDVSCIADVRFKSEVNSIMKQKDSYIIRLKREIFNDNHISEKDLDGFDWGKYGDRALELDNRGMSIEEQNEKVINWIRERI